MAFDPFITRANLVPPAANLLLNDRVNYRYDREDGFEAEAITQRRNVVSSLYSAGDVLITAVADASLLRARILVLGATVAARNTNLATLLAAFRQLRYELHLVDDGVDYAWSCQVADYGLEFARLVGDKVVVPVNLSIPRQPSPLAGLF